VLGNKPATLAMNSKCGSRSS